MNPSREHISTELWELWSSPTAAYRGKPFWTWNSKLEKDELIHLKNS